ncbi:MAG: YraN family protein [Oscillospiraceae bacterium]|nr:YraN family protein [Oscillospiraceae bacterium]
MSDPQEIFPEKNSAMTAYETGRMGEDAVCNYLESQHYQILARNFRIRGGEIDLIACRNEELCFVEVKTRKKDGLTDGFSAVDRRKQRLLIRTAHAYCHQHQIAMNDWYLRYDIAVVTTWHDKIIHLEYLESAFDETDFSDYY